MNIAWVLAGEIWEGERRPCVERARKQFSVQQIVARRYECEPKLVFAVR